MTIASSGCFEHSSPNSVIDETRRQFADLRECLGPFPGSVEADGLAESKDDVGTKSYYAWYALDRSESSTTVVSETEGWWKDRCGVRGPYFLHRQGCPSGAYFGEMGLSVALVTDQPSPTVACASEGARVRLHAHATLPPWP